MAVSRNLVNSSGTSWGSVLYGTGLLSVVDRKKYRSSWL